MSLEMAIADFYAVNDLGIVKVLVKKNGECYILGKDQIGIGYPYDKEELEYAAITATIFDIEWIYEE